MSRILGTSTARRSLALQLKSGMKISFIFSFDVYEISSLADLLPGVSLDSGKSFILCASSQNQ